MRKTALLGLFLAFAGSVSTLPASSRGDFTMEILVDGRPVQELPHAGRTYVEARKGSEYAIRLTNRTGERVAVALAVDGLNSIDAKRTSAFDARKWILAPWQTITIEGWQTSGTTARRFYFTDREDSYGKWLGRTENLGIVSAAFFREKRPEISKLRQESCDRAAPKAMREQDEASTGIGREVEHRVRTVSFEAESAPSATIDLRYEYRDALVRLGVIPRHDDALARRERARGFEDGGYAPDPYRR